MPVEFEARLSAFAERAMRIVSHCASEEATRIYLVMPFLELLGYDAGDPSVIIPEHESSIDFAIMVDGKPGIAIAATASSNPTADVHPRLRGYWNARKTLKLGVATNGIIYEVFIDSEVPHVLDAEPFVTLDLEAIASGRIDAQHLKLFQMISAPHYDPAALAEHAYATNLLDRLKGRILEEFRHPSEALCRLLLEQIGIRNARVGVIDQHYRAILKSSMEQAIIVPVIQALRRLPAPVETAAAQSVPQVDTGTIKLQASGSLGDELAAFSRSRRRSA